MPNLRGARLYAGPQSEAGGRLDRMADPTCVGGVRQAKAALCRFQRADVLWRTGPVPPTMETRLTENITMSNLNTALEFEAARDPVTGALGTHTRSTGLGALVGGFAGQSVAKPVDRAREDAYRQGGFADRCGVDDGSGFDDFGPAYDYGVAAHGRYPGRSFDDVETDLSRDWGGSRGNSRLSWDAARHAVRDAWERVSDVVERVMTPSRSD